VDNDNNLVEVVRGENLRNGETGGLSIERGASYPIGDWEYLVSSFKIGGNTRRGAIIPPRQ